MSGSFPRIIIQAGLALALGAPVAGAMPPLQIVATDVPPLVFAVSGQPQGFCADIVRELQRRSEDVAAEIEFLPWPRVLMAARDGGGSVLVTCPKRTPEREQQFQWVGPLFVSRTYLYVRDSSPVRLGSLEEARALSGVMVPRASYSYELLRAQGFSNLVPTTGTGLVSLKMLLADREPALVLEEEQLEALLREGGLPPDSVRPAWLAAVAHSYLAFSRSTPKTRMVAWQQALIGMKRDGSFERLYRRWFGADSKPPPELLQLAPAPQALPVSR